MPACEDDTADLPNVITRGSAGSGARPGPTAGAGGNNASTPAASGTTTPSGRPGQTGGSTGGTNSGVAGAGGVDAGTDAGTDAGVPADAGVVADAGAVASDAGVFTDAGLVTDAGAALINALADGQILYVVDTLNAGEVEQAQAALPRLSNDAVRSFAQVMVQEHQAARTTLLTFAEQQQIGLQGSNVADLLRLQSLQLERAIDAAPVGEVDRVYVDSQVTAHGQASDLLENLIDAADSPALRAELTQMRLNVLGHLQAAEGLQSSLGG